VFLTFLQIKLDHACYISFLFKKIFLFHSNFNSVNQSSSRLIQSLLRIINQTYISYAHIQAELCQPHLILPMPSWETNQSTPWRPICILHRYSNNASLHFVQGPYPPLLFLFRTWLFLQRY
jgi:hypothetical protein